MGIIINDNKDSTLHCQKSAIIYPLYARLTEDQNSMKGLSENKQELERVADSSAAHKYSIC